MRLSKRYQFEDGFKDPTWRLENKSDIRCLKNNVLVYIMAGGTSVNQLPLTRSVARKIEAKIDAVLKKTNRFKKELQHGTTIYTRRVLATGNRR